MSTEGDFTPRLGKLRDVGAGSSKRFRSRVLKAAGALSSRATKPAFSGARLGRGRGAGLQARQQLRRISRMRQRRVVVKVHIARARSGIGARAYGRHLDYIQRDGVERDGSGGELYGREGAEIDARAFAARSADDRHQFRLIVSPEDADQLGDLKDHTRKLMTEMERDLGTRLDWVAADHYNTGHAHTHIVIRGKDGLGQDLVIARDYLTKGLRARAEEILTQELGPRRDIEIMQSRHREVSQDRFTGLDREIDKQSIDLRVELSSPKAAAERFGHSLQKQRLSHLEQLHLAKDLGGGSWQLSPNWQSALKTMGRKGDIIRTLAAQIEPGRQGPDVRFFEDRDARKPPVVGIVAAHGPEDELRDHRFLIVDDFHGTSWHVPISNELGGITPPIGAIVELSPITSSPRRSDRTIADLALRHGGVYSDALHAAHDPSASSAYRLAHKRRLESLRRAGIVSRMPDGAWKIGEDFLERAAKFDAENTGRISVRVKSWMSIEAQIEAHAETWLDQMQSDNVVAVDSRLSDARKQRQLFLRREGILSVETDRLSMEARKTLKKKELLKAGEAESARSNLAYKALAAGESFEGKYERTLDLAQGRMAIIGNQKAFALVPWRPDLERGRGRSLILEQKTRGVSWSFASARSRGLSR